MARDHSRIDYSRPGSRSTRDLAGPHYARTLKTLREGSYLAAKFTRANSEYLSIADNAALSMGNIDFTIAGWVWFDSVAHTRQDIFAKWNTGVSQEYLIRYNTAVNAFTFGLSPTGLDTNVINHTAFGPATANTWYFIVAWHDAAGDIYGIQVNNTAPTSAAHAPGVFDSLASLGLGFRVPNTTDALDGRMDSWGVWKRLLTTAEKTWLYNAGKGRSYRELGREGDGLALKTNLQAWWDLDEESGQRNDSHGTNHLTDNNTVTRAAGVSA